MKRAIADKILEEDDIVIGVAKNVNMSITYDVTTGKAFGYYDLSDANGKVLRVKANIPINTEGWGEDDNIMIQRFATQIGVVLI